MTQELGVHPVETVFNETHRHNFLWIALLDTKKCIAWSGWFGWFSNDLHMRIECTQILRSMLGFLITGQKIKDMKLWERRISMMMAWDIKGKEWTDLRDYRQSKSDNKNTVCVHWVGIVVWWGCGVIYTLIPRYGAEHITSCEHRHGPSILSRFLRGCLPITLTFIIRR